MPVSVMFSVLINAIIRGEMADPVLALIIFIIIFFSGNGKWQKLSAVCMNLVGPEFQWIYFN